MKKQVEVTIEIPDVPNYLRNTVKGREKAILVPIEDFTEEELKVMGNEWTQALIKKAKKRRKPSPN